MKTSFLTTYILFFFATISNCQIAKCVVYFDKNVVECSKDSAKSKIVITRSEAKTFTAKEYYYSDFDSINRWQEKSNYVILFTDNESTDCYYFKRVYDISCNVESKIFDDKCHKVSFSKTDSCYYLKIFNPAGILIEEGIQAIYILLYGTELLKNTMMMAA